MRLHWSPDSANLIVRIALEMLDLPFEGVRVNRAAAEHRSEAFRRINPQGLLPVLEDGDLVLFETAAILWHLAERAGRLGPDGPPFEDRAARADALKWMFYLSNTVHADLRLAFYPHRYVAEPDAVAALRRGVAARMAGHVDLLEADLGRRADEPRVGLTDIYTAILLRWARVYPVVDPVLKRPLSGWPRLHARAQRLESDPAAIRAFEAESIPARNAVTDPRLPDLPADEVTGAQPP